jgi:hypothetical protein
MHSWAITDGSVFGTSDGIVFGSGARRNGIAFRLRLNGPAPWKVSISHARAELALAEQVRPVAL